MSLLVLAKRGARWLRRHLIPAPLHRLEDTEILSDPSSAAVSEMFTDLLMRDEPIFIARIGGSDYEAVKSHFNDRDAFKNEHHYETTLAILKEYNGYFDFENSRATFIQFLEDMMRFYKKAESLFYAGPDMIANFRKNAFAREDIGLLDHICRGKTLVDYTFVEAVMPFLNSFKSWGEGKRILVISPFSASLEHQYQRRNDLIVDYQFPEFDLVTYASPITYNTLGDDQQTLGISTANWHEECQRMSEEIAELEFDIAFLSCASYSMYLGDFISQSMQKKAVYVGGVLNVLFNIYGERYDTPYFNSLMREEAQIEAFENDDVAQLKGGWGRESEALRAYFGKRKR